MRGKIPPRRDRNRMVRPPFCSRGFTGSRSTGCARKSSRFPLPDFQRFLLAWQHVAPENQMEEIAASEAILHLLDGYELPATAWEPAVLAMRVKNYDPRWLDQLCFTGRVGWGRLSPPQNQKTRAFTPLRSSPIALFARENSRSWLELAAPLQKEFSSETEFVLKTLAGRWRAIFR